MQSCISDTPEVDVEKVEGVKKEEKTVPANTENTLLKAETSSLNHEAKSDSGDTNTPLTTPEVTDLDEPEKSSDVPAADETASEEAAIAELKEVDEEVSLYDRYSHFFYLSTFCLVSGHSRIRKC